jgi:protoheme IX farnesyltransferase
LRAVLTTVASRSRVRAFVALTKPRIIELLLVTTVPTMVVAERGLPSLWLMVATVVGGTLAAGGANAMNMVIDRDIDAVMERTRHRPLVTGDVTPTEAMAFAVALEAVAFAWLWVLVNPLSGVLAVAACLFYVVVYTIWLKRTSTSNIVIGGAAGAAPVLIGWVAVTGALAWEPLLLFAIIFFWTPPHYWPLAIKYTDDYSAAGVPMMPVVEGFRRTSLRILRYTLIVWVLTVAFGWVADLSWIYLGAAMIVGAAFTGGALGLVREEDPQRAAQRSIRLFAFSITHLTVLFAAMAVDQLILGGGPR